MITSLIRPYIINLKPYCSARDKYQAGVLLDANENPFGSVAETRFAAGLNRYPDPGANKLREALAQFAGTPAENVFVGNGSDEIIDLLIRLFVDPGEEVIIFEPTYGLYRVAALVANAQVRICLLTDDLQIDLAAYERAVTPKTKILFCCSPNNPTGNALAASAIEQLCRSFRGIVVLDEAYIEFSERESLAKKVAEYQNLVVLRTFSKAWGLAGLRVGYAIANPTVVRYLNKIKLPYNINRLSAGIALKALAAAGRLPRACKRIIAEREKLTQGLTRLGLKVFPSETNFVLVRCPQATRVVECLAQEYGIIVRDVSDKPLLADCFRITVGMPDENQQLLQSLVRILCPGKPHLKK